VRARDMASTQEPAGGTGRVGAAAWPRTGVVSAGEGCTASCRMFASA
jgi:hypothetical protein